MSGRPTRYVLDNVNHDDLVGHPGGGIPDAPSDGDTYGRLNAAWTQVLPLAGGELSGPLNLPNGTLAAPSLQLGAADGTGFNRSGNALSVGVQGSMAASFFNNASQFYGSVFMLGNRIQQVADATAVADALNLRTGDARYIGSAGGTFTGPVTMSAALTLNAPAAANAGLSFGNAVAADPSDFSRHIALYGNQYGLSVSGGRLNYVTGGWHVFLVGSTDVVTIDPARVTVSTNATVTGLLNAGNTSGASWAFEWTANGGALPNPGFVAALGFNYSGGWGEADFLNCFPDATDSFWFYQRTSAGTAALVASISAAGELRINSVALATDPAAPLQAATKQYVDSRLGAAPGAWQLLPVDGGWTSSLRYRRVPGGMQLDGTAAGALTVNAKARIGVLPPGDRPAYLLHLAGVVFVPPSTYGAGMVEIDPDGQVWTYWSIAGTDSLISLSGVVAMD